jgi:hypothetical protein
MAIKRYVCMVGCCIAVLATLRPALATQPKKNAIYPVATSSPIAGAASIRRSHMSPASLQREMQELEHAKHFLQMSSQNDHSSHAAIAARHIQTAINELKLEAEKNSREKRSGQLTQAVGTATPGARR